MFTKARFIQSSSDSRHFPVLKNKQGRVLPEIAFVGRSNVGKSSLINHLTQNKKLAHVSSKPGKTQLINFFSLDDQIALVDLPGYGFSKTSKSTREKWGDLVQDYLGKRKNLALILLLVDLRHPPSEDDLSFVSWATHFKKPFLIVFTKADKLNKGIRQTHAEKNFALLLEVIGDTPVAQITYSIKEPQSRTYLIKEIEKRVL